MEGSYSISVINCSISGENVLHFDDVVRSNHVSGSLDGHLIAHDLLEHVNGLESIGSIDDELEALGAAWLIRGQFGCFRREYRGGDSCQTGLANSIEDLWHYYKAGVDFKTPVPIYTDIEQESLYEEFKCILDLVYFDDDDEIVRLSEFKAAVIPYLLAGFDKADDRFKFHLDAYDLFFGIVDVINSHIDHSDLYEGQTFELVIHGSEVSFVETNGENYEAA